MRRNAALWNRPRNDALLFGDFAFVRLGRSLLNALHILARLALKHFLNLLDDPRRNDRDDGSIIRSRELNAFDVEVPDMDRIANAQVRNIDVDMRRNVGGQARHLQFVGDDLGVATVLDLARREGARTVDLTSRPSREQANRLYRRIGFVQRETNVYRFDLSEL